MPMELIFDFFNFVLPVILIILYIFFGILTLIDNIIMHIVCFGKHKCVNCHCRFYERCPRSVICPEYIEIIRKKIEELE